MNKPAVLDMTNLPKELKLILEILKIENGVFHNTDDYKEVDWELFLQLSLHHRLFPIVYTKLKTLENKMIPEKMVQALALKYRNNTFHMLHLSAIMEQLSQLFIQNQIRPLFLKGPVLAYDLYGDLSLRTCGDLDILISVEDLEKAEHLLFNLGYVKDEYIKSLLNDWKWRHHHFTYFHPTAGTKVELHWRLNPFPSKEPSFSELWERRRLCPLTSYPTYFMGQEDLFFYLVLHGARHGWSRLRWLDDIHRLIERDLNWKDVNKLFQKYQCAPIGGQALILSSQLLSSTIPTELHYLVKKSKSYPLAQASLFYIERMVNLHTDPVPREIAEYHSHHLFSLMSLKQKLIYWLSILYPYYTDVETLPLPKRLHFLYFPLRPFLIVLRKTRKHALS